MVSAGRAAVYAAALVVRLVLAPFFGHSWDLFIWVKSGELFYRGVNVYEVRSLTDFPWGFYTYPPGWLYWLGTAYALFNTAKQLQPVRSRYKTPHHCRRLCCCSVAD